MRTGRRPRHGQCAAGNRRWRRTAGSYYVGRCGHAEGKSAGPGNNAQKEAHKQLIAEAMKPSLPTYHEPSSVASPPRHRPCQFRQTIEQRVFGTKRYYSLIMNMPNLTSASGSWIIRFAELKQWDDKIPLTAPVGTKGRSRVSA